MARATIKIEFTAGDDIKSAFQEAIRIAKLMDVHVEFNFNGVLCFASPHSDPQTGEKEYLKAITKDKFKLAFS